MKGIILHKTLKAAYTLPKLLNNVQLENLRSSKELLAVLEVLAIHKPNPPLVYTHFCRAYNPYSYLKTLDTSSFSKLSESLLATKYIQPPFELTNQEKLELLTLLEQLSELQVYSATSKPLIDKFLKELMNSEEFLQDNFEKVKKFIKA